MTFATFVQSDEEKYSDQQKDKYFLGKYSLIVVVWSILGVKCLLFGVVKHLLKLGGNALLFGEAEELFWTLRSFGTASPSFFWYLPVLVQNNYIASAIIKMPFTQKTILRITVQKTVLWSQNKTFKSDDFKRKKYGNFIFF